MKLIKIYANKPFKKIRFNSGFNVILGEPKDKKRLDRDTHNLGKSFLIQVIDFLMLKKNLTNHVFSTQRSAFPGYLFYLEIQLNSGKYLLIKRGIEYSTKISFKINASESNEFNEDLVWDHEDIAIDDAKDMLNKYLDFDVATSRIYRISLSYFLRTQKDFQDVFQLAKFNKGRHREWKPFLFELLGFDGKCLFEKYEIEEKKEKLITLISQVKEQFAPSGEQTDKIKGIIDLKSEEKKELEIRIDGFNFYLQDKKINQKLVDETDTKISSLNTIRYHMTEEISRIKESLKMDVPRINIEELKHLYEEIKIFFPNNLSKEYKELEHFNLQVSEERKKYLTIRLQELKKELEPVEKELQNLDKTKSEMLSLLKDQNSYQKFKAYQHSLAKIEAEIARLEEKMVNMGKMDELERQVEELQGEIKRKAEEIKHLIDVSNDKYREIRLLFNRIIREVLSVPAILSIKQNKEGNIEFQADIQNAENMEITSEGYGTTYKKMLCMAFDLAVLATYRKKSFYRFVYHDGALEGLDNRKKVKFLQMVKLLCQEYDLQYIMTLIDSDIPRDEQDKPIPFSDSEIILRLNDRDDSGRLFEKSF